MTAAGLLNWREVDFVGVVIVGLIAGYVMTMVGLWAGRIPGLVAFDIADFGRRYMASDRPSAWLFGLASHLVNSVIFTFLWASAILPHTPHAPLASGLAWGLFLGAGFSGALISPMAGLGFMARKTGSFRLAGTNLLLHLIWGLCIGLFYKASS